ncbi:HNH endonuclease [Sulfitobacter sp.]|uniref:HNH endonuclease n=1 Tax=Sulfitobacter sp. TaxID=1903071 RepID=UPI003297512D
MPRPPHICTRCNATVPHGALCACQQAAKRERNRRHDRKRPTAAQRGYNSAWRTASKAFLKINDRCAWSGCSKPSTVVDHVIPHRGNDKLFWDKSNWQPLCTRCHNSKKQRVERVR